MQNQLTKGRAIRVKFISPTNWLGARVGIADSYFEDRIQLPYDYKIGNFVRQAEAFLEERGFEVAMVADTRKECFLFVRGFEPRLKNPKSKE